MTKNFRAIVKADLFLRAQACVSTEEVRYYLQGVHIEPCDQGGVLLVSADGCRLICLRDKDGFVEGGTAIIRAERHFIDKTRRVVAHPKRFCMSALADLFVVVDGQNAGLVESGGPNPDHDAMFASLTNFDKLLHSFQWGSIIDGTFPNWRAVVPKRESLKPGGKRGTINLKILTPLVSALSADDKTIAPSIVPSSSIDGMGAHLVMVRNPEIDGFGIVMPMRACPPETLPDWFTEPKKPEPVKAEEPQAPEPEKKAERKRAVPVKRAARAVAAPRKASKKIAPVKAKKRARA